MAKIGTAHVEIKPVLNEEALDELTKRIEDAVYEGVSRALGQRDRKVSTAYIASVVSPDAAALDRIARGGPRRAPEARS